MEPTALDQRGVEMANFRGAHRWAVGVLSAAVSTVASAMPVTYQLQGHLSIDSVGSAAGDLAARLDPSIFGSWTGSVTYDGATAIRDSAHDTYLAVPPSNQNPSGLLLIGESFGVAGSLTMTLADGTVLSTSGLSTTLWNDDAPWGAGFAVTTSWGIPVSMWIAGARPQCSSTSSPLCWLSWVSGLSVTLEEPWSGNVPPPDLGGMAGGAVVGRIGGDFNHDDLVSLDSETINLGGDARVATAIPEPTSLALVVLVLPLLAASASRLRILETRHPRSPTAG
jgi:hypothetical protein